QAVGGIISAVSTGIVYKGGARGVNAENRSQLARIASATGDYVTSAVSLTTGIQGAMAAHTFGDGMTGVLGAMSGALLGAGRLHSQFPNATPWIARLPTGIALLPVGIFAITQGYGLITAFTGSDEKDKKPGSGATPKPTPSGSASASPTPSTSLAPTPTATTTQPGASASPTAAAKPSATPSQPAQPSTAS
ncbi:hypothetical protein OIV57_33515, partial [Burkholderia pseudomallei]|nr:hypothetical protein [Burkholderia pseudomallei]